MEDVTCFKICEKATGYLRLLFVLLCCTELTVA